MITDLACVFDSRKSFYGKARLQIDCDEITLFSYGTAICKINVVTNQLTRLYDGYTLTTWRHIKEFFKQFSVNIETLTEWNNIPLNKAIKF